jgi:hypothetical protein
MGKKKRTDDESANDKNVKKSKVCVFGSGIAIRPRGRRLQSWNIAKVVVQAVESVGVEERALAKRKLLKLTKKLQQPGLQPGERAYLLSKIEGRLAKLDALPGQQSNGHAPGNALCIWPPTTFPAIIKYYNIFIICDLRSAMWHSRCSAEVSACGCLC